MMILHIQKAQKQNGSGEDGGDEGPQGPPAPGLLQAEGAWAWSFRLQGLGLPFCCRVGVGGRVMGGCLPGTWPGREVPCALGRAFRALPAAESRTQEDIHEPSARWL